MAEEQFWMVWNINGGNPTVKHPGSGLAAREAERLAGLHPGQRFYVVKALRYAEMQRPITCVELQPPSARTVNDDGIPF